MLTHLLHTLPEGKKNVNDGDEKEPCEMMSNLKSTGGGGNESKETAKAKGLEINEARDSIAEVLSKEECTKDCDEST